MRLDDVLMVVLHNAVAVGAGVSLFAILCRVDALRYRAHRLSIVLMHVCMGICCVMAGGHALAGATDALDAAAVAGSLCWIRASYRNWRSGVPETYRTSPTPLDEPAPATRPPAA